MTKAKGTDKGKNAMLLTLHNDSDHARESLPAIDLQEAGRSLSEAGYSVEAIALLGISRIHGVGFQTLTKLGGRAGISSLLCAKDVGTFSRSLSEAGGKPSAGSLPETWDALRRTIWQAGLATATTLADTGVRFCFQGDPTFPKALIDLAPASQPGWLFYRGDLDLLDHSCITIVGTRDPSQNGDFLARYAVSCARELRAPVVSGLAYGIDRIVHEWCLHVGLPTVSVLGTGILTTYPAKHAALADQIIAADGLIVSEYMPHQGPSGENFVWRNRLQAALGCVVIPAEWSKKSGTAHTVRFARKLGRPVLSVSVAGAARAPDAGEGDRHFEIPRDHNLFAEAIASTFQIRSPTPVTQMDLFGTPP